MFLIGVLIQEINRVLTDTNEGRLGKTRWIENSSIFSKLLIIKFLTQNCSYRYKQFDYRADTNSETVCKILDYQLYKLEVENHLPSIGSSSTFVKRPVETLMKKVKTKVREVTEFEYQHESILQVLA